MHHPVWLGQPRKQLGAQGAVAGPSQPTVDCKDGDGCDEIFRPSDVLALQSELCMEYELLRHTCPRSCDGC